MEEADNRTDNPYTEMEGYTVRDPSGLEVGTVEWTVYDAPGDVLKYIIVDERPVPAEDIRVDPDRRLVSIPYDRKTVESAPEIEDEVSGAFDRAIHEHYARARE